MTALDAPPETLSEYEQGLVADVRVHGWRGTHVLKDEEGPGFSYSAGFWLTHGQPEVILFDLPPDLSHDLLGAIHRRLGSGETLPVGRPVSGIIRDEVVYFFPVTLAGNQGFLLASGVLYGAPEFPSLQMVWGDAHGLFPWDEGFNPNFVGLQPDLSPDGWARALAG